MVSQQEAESWLGAAQGWLAEATELRKVGMPGPADGPEQVHERLLEAAGRLDRVEELLSVCVELSGRLALAARELEDAADHAWDQAADQAARTASSGMDYETGRERQARYSLKTFAPRSAARRMRATADTAARAEQRLRLCYWGLKGVCDVLESSLRYHSLESTLNR